MGKMSLIGPRPELLQYVNQYTGDMWDRSDQNADWRLSRLLSSAEYVSHLAGTVSGGTGFLRLISACSRLIPRACSKVKRLCVFSLRAWAPVPASPELIIRRRLMNRLFPAADTIQNRYTYLQKYPWLLPAAWVHRLVKTRGRFHDHTVEARGILSANKEAVQKLSRVYEAIGL